MTSTAPLRLAAALAALALAGPLQAQAQTRPLNDTGMTWSRAGGGDAGNSDAANCSGSHPAGQDCRYGRDKAAAGNTLIKAGSSTVNNGVKNGFDYTKVCNSGQLAGQETCPADPALGPGPDEWACTKDNVTKLIWEVKVDDASHLRHKSHTYTWYMTDSPDGNAGNASGGSCKTAGRCDTEKFVSDVNVVGLCGKADWRMPTVKELEGIVDFGRTTSAIDPGFFPNTPAPSQFWAGSPWAGTTTSFSWNVNFGDGQAIYERRVTPYRVRLVRGGQ